MWGYLNAWWYNKFIRNTELVSRAMYWLYKWWAMRSSELKEVWKIINWKLRNFGYLYITALKLDRFQTGDEDNKTIISSFAKILHNDFVSFSSVMWPVLKTYETSKAKELWLWDTLALWTFDLVDRLINQPKALYQLADRIVTEFVNKKEYDAMNKFELMTAIYDSVITWIAKWWEASHRFNQIIKRPDDIKKFNWYSTAWVMWYWDQSIQTWKTWTFWDFYWHDKRVDLIQENDLWTKTKGISRELFMWYSNQSKLNREIAKKMDSYIEQEKTVKLLWEWKINFEELINIVTTDKDYFIWWKINTEEQLTNYSRIMWIISTHLRYNWIDYDINIDWTNAKSKSEVELKRDIISNALIDFENAYYEQLWKKDSINNYSVFMNKALIHSWLKISLPELTSSIAYKKFNDLKNKIVQNKTWWKQKYAKKGDFTSKQLQDLQYIVYKDMWDFFNHDQELVYKLQWEIIRMNDWIQQSHKENFWTYLESSYKEEFDNMKETNIKRAEFWLSVLWNSKYKQSKWMIKKW